MRILKNNVIAIVEFVLIIILIYVVSMIIFATFTIVIATYGTQAGHLSQTFTNVLLITTLFFATVAGILLTAIIHKKIIIPYFLKRTRN